MCLSIFFSLVFAPFFGVHHTLKHAAKNGGAYAAPIHITAVE